MQRCGCLSNDLETSSRIHFPAVFGRAKEVSIRHRRRFHQIHGAAKQRFEIELQPHVSLEGTRDWLRAEIDKEIVVTPLRIEIFPHGRPE